MSFYIFYQIFLGERLNETMKVTMMAILKDMGQSSSRYVWIVIENLE
jgi:hypothetical protein